MENPSGNRAEDSAGILNPAISPDSSEPFNYRNKRLAL